MGGPETIDPWAEVFQVNVIGTMRLTLALLPQIEAGGRKIVSLTSRLGSIGENADGGIAGYRASKAALNAAMRTLAHEVAGKGITVGLVTPGWVRTEMGGPGAPVTAEERVEDRPAAAHRTGAIGLLPQSRRGRDCLVAALFA